MKSFSLLGFSSINKGSIFSPENVTLFQKIFNKRVNLAEDY